MRIFTEKDRRGLLVAFRVFVRDLSGERISAKAGEDIINRALSGGVTVDALLNRENWGRALQLSSSLSARDYVDVLIEKRIDVHEIKDEPMWHEPQNGFTTIAEAAHDFFLEVSGRGGKWNIPSALKNLAKVIRDYSLQAVLSEALIGAVLEKDPETTYFNYLVSLIADFDSLPIDTSLSEQQEQANSLAEETVESMVEKEEEGGAAGEEAAADLDEDEPYPETFDQDTDPEAGGAHFETAFLSPNNPREMKRESLRLALEGYTPIELSGLIETIEAGSNKVLSEIIDAFVDGKFDVSRESAAARDIHRSLTADLLPAFIDCVRMQGVEIEEKSASQFDVLHDSWDLRTAEVRKLHKLKRLILTYGSDDPDMLAAIEDIETLYSAKD